MGGYSNEKKGEGVNTSRTKQRDSPGRAGGCICDQGGDRNQEKSGKEIIVGDGA